VVGAERLELPTFAL